MPVVEILRGLFRKIVKVDGSTRPMGGPNTTAPAWITTAPYDPLNGEILAGIDGPERVQLAANGKLYPPLTKNGFIRSGVPSALYGDAVPIAQAEILPAKTDGNRWRLISLVNTSGAAIQVRLCRTVAPSGTFYYGSVPANSTVMLDNIDTVGPVCGDGAGAAGVSLAYTVISGSD